MNRNTVDEVRKRTERYWYEDGIWEISFGLAIAVLAGVNFLVVSLAKTNFPAGILVLLQVASIGIVFLLVGRLVRFLKERITYPRTGYVCYHKPAPLSRARRILVMVLLATGLSALIGLLSAFGVVATSVALITGIILGTALVYLGVHFDLMRMFVLAALTLALGGAVALLPVGESFGTAFFFGGFSLLFLFSGAGALWSYLRRTQSAGADDDYEAPNQPSREV